jgi:SAM-dependent methyltransferase
MGADKDNHALDLNAQLRWLERVLPPPPARVLDAGCGTGVLAQALSGRGYDVTAIDVDPAAVEAARKAGVAALLADLTVYDSEPFEAVVFSLSLHHMHPLGKAAERAGELVAPGGRLVLDEFAWDWADRAAAAWFYDTAELLAVAGVLERVEGLSGPDRLACWRAGHADHTGGDAMIQAVSARLEVTELRREPYLSRYLGGRLEATARGGRILEALRRIERDQIADGALPPTGFRLVARKGLRQIGPRADRPIPDHEGAA